MPLNFSLNGMIDLRMPIAGDSFGWEALEPAAAKKSLVIHHSASPGNQDAFDIANYHVGHNGWGGIGYHFVITHDSYPGRAGYTPAGAQIQYVGDLLTWRAHVESSNNGRVGICLVGNFVNDVPGPNQLRLARSLIDFFIAKNNVLPSINFYSQVTGHGLIPGQQTACPGYSNPQFNTWFSHLAGGAFPDALYGPPTPAPAPPPPPTPAPTPVPEPPAPVPTPTPEPGMGGSPGQTNGDVPVVATPQYLATFEEVHEPRMVLRDGAYAVDVSKVEVLEATRPNLTKGTTVDVWGYFTAFGDRYARTRYSVEHGTATGIPLSFLEAPDVATTVPDILDQPDLAQQLKDGFLQLPVEHQRSFFELLAELGAVTISPILRLLGIIKDKGKS